MVTSDKTGDEDTESAINELADDLLKDDSESVTDALEQALESVRAKDAQEELDRLLRAGKSLSSMKSKITAVCKPEYVAGSEYDRTQLDEMLLALRDADNNPLYTQKTLDSWVSDAEKKNTPAAEKGQLPGCVLCKNVRWCFCKAGCGRLDTGKEAGRCW